MATFKLPSDQGPIPESPEALFRDLRGRSREVRHLWSHQADLLRSYHQEHLDDTDLALELPTGAGKTLVGLLVGDYRRRARGERIVYLCPTRQLAHQVGHQAEVYSLPAAVFVGPQSGYDPAKFAHYRTGDLIAVTTYSGVFNSNPRLDDAQVLILDDAHAAETYIAGMWSVEIGRTDWPDLYRAVIQIFEKALPDPLLTALQKTEPDPRERQTVEKVALPHLWRRVNALRDVLDVQAKADRMSYPYAMIRGSLDACNMYLSWGRILIRPIIPPTLSHSPFAGARQRVYMSATLGEAGELERVIGIPRITRLPLPAGWEKQGSGRRFIVFPGHSLEPDEANEVALLAARDAGRTLVLCRDHQAVDDAKALFTRLGIPMLEARDIEESLSRFTSMEAGLLILANRYDGIDLPDEACRLLVLWRSPGGVNLQERFLLERVGATALLRDRIRTRITQGLGRCTRSATDYAAVIMLGFDLLTFCFRKETRDGMHPELQAEIQFGLENSGAGSHAALLDLIRKFLAQSEEWKPADEAIRSLREGKVRQPDPVATKLRATAEHEVAYQYALWKGDLRGALLHARRVCDGLEGGHELRPYRALWYYFAGAAAWVLSEQESDPTLKATADDFFQRALTCCVKATWFSELPELGFGAPPGSRDLLLPLAVDAVQRELTSLGPVGDRFERKMKRVLDLLNTTTANDFEQGLVELGGLLGFQAFKPKVKGAPDAVWKLGERVYLLFEAKSDESAGDPISLDTARQAQGHLAYARAKLTPPEEAVVLSVVVSPRRTLAPEARPSSVGLHYLHLDDMRELADNVVGILRRVRADSADMEEEAVGEKLTSEFLNGKIDPRGLIGKVRAAPLDGLSS